MMKYKGYEQIFCNWQRRIVALILYLSVFTTWFPASRASVCPDNSILKIYPVDIFNIHFSNYRTFGFRENEPFNHVPENDPVSKAVPKAPSDQCYLKEGHRLTADKGPETAIIAFSGICGGYPFPPVAFVSQEQFARISTWVGICFKIRPPPSYQSV